MGDRIPLPFPSGWFCIAESGELAPGSVRTLRYFGRDLVAFRGEAGEAAKAVRIHVERNNPALHLYHRLGFKQTEDQGVYYLMEWRPAPA